MLAELEGGLVLRTATPEDVEPLVAFGVAAHGEPEEWGIRTALADPACGPARTTVVCDGATIVSTLCLLHEQVRIGGPGEDPVQLGLGRPEYVASAPAYRRRGLIRRQMTVVHRWSDARGDLVQAIGGIPFFYRRFGYGYGASFPAASRVRAATPPAGVTVSPAEPADLPALVALHDQVVATADVALRRTTDQWRQLLWFGPRSGQELLVARRDGPAGGTAGAAPVEGFARVSEAAWPPRRVTDVLVRSADAARALVAAAAQHLGTDAVLVEERPRTPLDALVPPTLPDAPLHGGLYVRVPDPLSLLAALRPVLSARVRRSPLDGERVTVPLTWYSGGALLRLERGEVAVEPAAGAEDPEDEWLAVAPDLLGALVLGRFGARGLAARHDDVTLGRHAAAAEVLFPRLVGHLRPSL